MPRGKITITYYVTCGTPRCKQTTTVYAAEHANANDLRPAALALSQRGWIERPDRGWTCPRCIAGSTSSTASAAQGDQP